jgi:hypothetical protein
MGVFQNFGHCIAELQFGGWRSGDFQYIDRNFEIPPYRFLATDSWQLQSDKIQKKKPSRIV